MDYSKVEAERNTLLGVCKICDKPNIPFAKLSSHSQTCKKIKEIRQELLKVNEWLIAECQKAAQLKDKLFKLTTPVPTDRKKKNFNDTRSIQSNDKGSKLVQECMTPNPRTTRGFKNEKTFQPIANIPKNKEGEKEKAEVSKDQTAEDKKDKRPYKMRRCTSNDDLESVTIKKDDLKEERDKLLLTKVPKKETKNSMSEDEQPKPGQSNLSSSDDEIEKPSPSKQRFSHFKQYKLPSGQYNAVPETSSPLKVASSSTIRSNQDLAEPTEGLPVDEKVHPRLESKSSLLVDEKSHNPSKTQPTIDDNGEKKRDTADFLNDVYGTDSEKESSQNSDEQKEAQPASRPSSFFSRSVQQKKSFTPNQAESKIGNIGFSTKKDETEVPARVPEVPQSHAQEDLPTIKEQTKPISKDSSDKSSCFGDQLDLDDDSDEEDEKDEKTPPKGTEAFKKSSFGATSPQPVAPKVQEIAPVKEPEVIKPTPVSSLKLPIPLDKRGSMLTDNLKEPPTFISDLLNDSEEDSNCLGATSRSERSNPQQEEQTATTDLQTILPPKLAESSIVEEPKAVKEEETAIKPFILNMVKKKAALNETQSTKHDSTGLNLSVSASSQPQLDSKEAPAEETKEEPAKDDTEAKQKHKDKNALFNKVSKKKEFQTQIEEKKDQSAPKTDLEDKQSLDQQNLEFKQLKLAQDCFSQVVW
jgi:hypothetical protein